MDAQRPARGGGHERRGRSDRANQRKRLRLSIWFRLCVGFGVRINIRVFEWLQQRIGEQIQRFVVLVIRQRFGQRKRIEPQRIWRNGDLLDLTLLFS